MISRPIKRLYQKLKLLQSVRTPFGRCRRRRRVCPSVPPLSLSLSFTLPFSLDLCVRSFFSGFYTAIHCGREGDREAGKDCPPQKCCCARTKDWKSQGKFKRNIFSLLEISAYCKHHLPLLHGRSRQTNAQKGQ